MIRNLQKEKIKPNERIGVFVCKCGHNIAEYVDVEEVVETVNEHESVVFATFDEHTCSAGGQQRIKDAIKEHNLDAVVVSACSPKVHEGTFQKCIKEGGLNEAMLSISNIREQVSWAHGHGKKTDTMPITEKAIDITTMGVERARFLSPLEERWTDVKQHAVVIGGGISGIQSALDIANAGFKVTLIEREASIGGKMSMFNKVFPTNDCSACILTPKMNEVAENENIELLTLSEVEGFSGSIGNFTVTVRKKARYVTAECTFCDTCAQWCPIKLPDPFNINMKQKKAISRVFESAIPARYYIDAEHCTKLLTGKCGACAIKCPVDAIKFDMQDEMVDIQAGVVVVATGFKPYIPVEGELSYLNYGKSQNIITLLTAERLLSANGCSGGELWRPSDERIPNSIAFVLCVGSRDEQIDFNACSRACCMASIKNAALVKERYPDADVAIFYIDIRAYGKGYEEAYTRAQDLGVRFVKARPASVRVKPGTDNVIIEYEDFLSKIGPPTTKEEFELAVYATGMRPADGARELGHMIGLSTDAYGFFMEAHPKLKPVDSTVDGVFLAGACQYPKDIPDSVAQASGAAMKSINVLQAGKIKAEPAFAQIDKELCSGCRSCETVCPYHAITMTQENSHIIAEVNPNLCKACGLCSATCPTGIINAPGYTDEAIFAQIQMAYLT